MTGIGIKGVAARLRRVVAGRRSKATARPDDGLSARAVLKVQTFGDLVRHCASHGIEISDEALLGEYDFLKGRKVLLVSHELDLTGAPIALLGMARALKAAGYCPVVVSWREGDLAREYAHSGIPVLIDPVCFGPSSIAEYAHLFDVVVVNTIVAAPVVNLLAGSATPVLWWIHESALAYKDVGLVERMPHTLPDNVSVYAVGPYAKRQLLNCRPQYRVGNLVYGLLDKQIRDKPLAKHGGVRNSRFVFGIVGALEPRKGQDILARAIRMLPEQLVSNCRFEFVGEAKDEALHAELCALAGDFPQSIKLLGQVEHRRMAEFYESIDCLICPSRDDPMPVVVAEAMRAAKPIICSDNTGVAEIVRAAGCGVAYADNSADNLAGAIQLVLASNVAALQVWSKNSRAVFSGRFSMDVFSKNVLSVVDAVITVRGGE